MDADLVCNGENEYDDYDDDDGVDDDGDDDYLGTLMDAAVVP